MDSKNQEDFKAMLMLLLKTPSVNVQKYKKNNGQYDTTEDNIFQSNSDRNKQQISSNNCLGSIPSMISYLRRYVSDYK